MLYLLLQATTVPSSVTEMHCDITSRAGEEDTGTRRTGERQAFKTVWTQDSTAALLLVFLISVKMHVLYAFCF